MSNTRREFHFDEPDDSELELSDHKLEELMDGVERFKGDVRKFDPPPVKEDRKMLDARMPLRDLRKGKQ